MKLRSGLPHLAIIQLLLLTVNLPARLSAGANNELTREEAIRPFYEALSQGNPIRWTPYILGSENHPGQYYVPFTANLPISQGEWHLCYTITLNAQPDDTEKFIAVSEYDKSVSKPTDAPIIQKEQVSRESHRKFFEQRTRIDLWTKGPDGSLKVLPESVLLRDVSDGALAKLGAHSLDVGWCSSLKEAQERITRDALLMQSLHDLSVKDWNEAWKNILIIAEKYKKK